MSILSIVTGAIAQGIVAAGDAIVDVLVAASDPFDPQPGEDYSPSWTIYTGKGFWEMTKVEDFPNTEIQVNDRTLVLMQCAYDIDVHDYVNIDDKVYHVLGLKPDVVGSVRVLQKLLVREEQRTGIPWDSADHRAA